MQVAIDWEQLSGERAQGQAPHVVPAAEGRTLSGPGGCTAGGLPVGVQLVGPPRADFAFPQAGHAFEQETRNGDSFPAGFAAEIAAQEALAFGDQGRIALGIRAESEAEDGVGTFECDAHGGADGGAVLPGARSAGGEEVGAEDPESFGDGGVVVQDGVQQVDAAGIVAADEAEVHHAETGKGTAHGDVLLHRQIHQGADVRGPFGLGPAGEPVDVLLQVAVGQRAQQSLEVGEELVERADGHPGTEGYGLGGEAAVTDLVKEDGASVQDPLHAFLTALLDGTAAHRTVSGEGSLHDTTLPH